MNSIPTTNPAHCKSCYTVLDRHTPVGDGNTPKENDLSICAYCGTISSFDKDLNLVPMTAEQVKEMKENDYENWLILARASHYIQQQINKN